MSYNILKFRYFDGIIEIQFLQVTLLPMAEQK